jgi:hypothetical protein
MGQPLDAVDAFQLQKGIEVSRGRRKDGNAFKREMKGMKACGG